MTSRMRKHTRKRRWRLVRAFVAGFILTLLIAYAPAIFRDYYGPSNIDYPFPDNSPPRYLDGLVPKFSSATRNQPDVESCRGLGRTHLFQFSVDIIVFTYGDPETDWIIERDGDQPPGVQVWRYRFGWPFRAIYMDAPSLNYSTIDGAATAQDVQSYLDRMLSRTGYRSGVQSPKFFPCWMEYHYIPIAPLWFGILIDTVFWSICWVIPGAIWHSVRTARRKRRGLCLACGYAVEDLEVCPECGSDHAVSIEKLET